MHHHSIRSGERTQGRSRIFYSATRHGTPGRSPARRFGIAAGEQHLQLVALEEPALWPCRRRPPAETPLRKPLLAKPKTLAVVKQNLHRRRPAVAEDEGPAVHRIPFELLAADGRQTVDSLAEVDRLDRHQDPHGRGGLDHPSPSPEHAAQRNGLRRGFALEMDPQLPASLVFGLQNALRQGSRPRPGQLHKTGPLLRRLSLGGPSLHPLLQPVSSSDRKQRAVACTP